MCRLYGFRANEPTKVECTLVLAQNALLMQSRSDLRGVRHPDGWGIGYYEHGQPRRERRATAAFEDAHFSLTAERMYTRSAVAHVRLATVGTPSEVNTHPFSVGPWLFAHNGTVRGFPMLQPAIEAETDADLLAARLGGTDSETAFCWLLTRLRRAGIDPGRPCEDLPALIDVMSIAVTELAGRCECAEPERPPKLNFLLTDGRVLLATRWNNSLHWVARDGVRDCEICGIPHVHHEVGTPYRAVVIASEPISHERWREVENFSLIAVDVDVRTHLYPLAPGAAAA